MTDIWLISVGFWVLVFGSIGALIGPRKGYTPGGGFAIAGIFGIFGIAYLALRPDVQDEPTQLGPGPFRCPWRRTDRLVLGVPTMSDPERGRRTRVSGMRRTDPHRQQATPGPMPADPHRKRSRVPMAVIAGLTVCSSWSGRTT